MKEREFIDRCVVAIGVPYSTLTSQVFCDCIERYMELKGYKYNYTRVVMEDIYEEMAERYDITPDRARKYCYKSIDIAYKRTKFKDFYKSFYVCDIEIKPSVKEFCELMVLKYKYEVLGNESKGINI